METAHTEKAMGRQRPRLERWSLKPRSVGSHQRLEGVRNEFSPRASRRSTPLPDSGLLTLTLDFWLPEL